MEAPKSQIEALLQEERIKIDRLLDDRDYDGLESIDGIKIVERREQRPQVEDCLVYVFGQEGMAQARQYKDALNIVTEGEETTDPVAGDYVFYFDSKGNFNHVGISQGGDRVRSRFGIAHVYDHPRRLVPTYYGNTIKTFINPEVPRAPQSTTN